MRLTSQQFVALASRPRTGRPAGSKDKQKRRPGSGLYQRETLIQKAILKYLELHPKVAFAFRANTGMIPINDAEYGQRWFRSGFPGLSDIVGMLKDARWLAIEVKRPHRKPTADQAAFLERVRAHGGVAFVATCITDVERNLR